MINSKLKYKWIKWIGVIISGIIGLIVAGILKGYIELYPMGLFFWAATGGIISIIIPWIFLGEPDDINKIEKENNMEIGQICCAISLVILFAISGWSNNTGIERIIYAFVGVLLGGSVGYFLGWIPSIILKQISIWIDYDGTILSMMRMATGSIIIYPYIGAGVIPHHKVEIETLLFPIPIILIFSLIAYIVFEMSNANPENIAFDENLRLFFKDFKIRRRERMTTKKMLTEKLLSQARELTIDAEKSFTSRNYENAITLWKKALEEYSREKELSVERKENEITEKLSEVEKKIKEQILNAEISIDNRAMHVLIDSGNKAASEANRLYKDGKFDDSKNDYENAKKAFTDALYLAQNRNFADDKAKLEESLKSIDKSIESSLLSKGEAMLREAEEIYQRNEFGKAGQAFSSSLEYLNKLQISRKKELEDMIELGREGLIKSKFEQGKEKIRNADRLYKSNKYYDAKESYKQARNFLEEVRDESTTYKLSNLANELNSLVHACSQKITNTSNALLDIGTKNPDIKSAEKVEIGEADFKGKSKKPVPVTPFPEPKPKIQESESSYSYITLERTIYEPVRRDFIISSQRPLVNVKDWIDRNDPSMYWFIICINNNSDKPIEEWGIELETPPTLKILDARVEGAEHVFNVTKSLSKPWLVNWILGVSHHLAIDIPRKGSKRIYFKLGSDACGVSYSIKGKVSTSDCEIPIKEKHFKFSCDAANLRVAIKSNPEEAQRYAQTILSNTYSKDTALKLLNAFKIVQEIDRCCASGNYGDLIDKLNLLKNALESAKVGEHLIGIVRDNLENVSIMGETDESAQKAKKLCSNLIDVWINEVLRV
ncbi:MAG: hypothetical protein WC556_11050 [Candidatus Methanoperedens sp.]